MESIKQTAEVFLFFLGFGSVFFTFLVDSKKTGAGFIKLISAVSAGSLLISLLINISRGFEQITYLVYPIAIGILLNIIIYFFHRDGKTLWMRFIDVLLFASFLGGVHIQTGPSVLPMIYYLATFGFIGIINYQMLLGHYYLVVPRLSERPLLSSLKITWFFMLIKIVLTGYAWGQSGEYFELGTQMGDGYAFNWMMLSMRIGFGHLAIGVLSFFAWRLCVIRSIQSATGVLYVMVFFMLIAELASNYWFVRYGLTL